MVGSGFIARPGTAFGRSTVVFKGCNKISLDVKGRLTLPTRCRDGLVEADGNTVVVTIDLREVCLLMYPATAWAAVEAMLTALPNLDEHYRRMQRLVLGHATEVEVDSAGRLVLPPDLREYAGLDRRLALVGQANKLEVWSEESWDARRADWRRVAGEDLRALPENERQMFLDRL